MYTVTLCTIFKSLIKYQDYDNVTLVLLLFRFHSLFLTNFYLKDENAKIFTIFTNTPQLPSILTLLQFGLHVHHTIFILDL